METGYQKYKGIHPGAIIERELSKRSMAQRPFALSLGEHPQTFNAIIKGRRRLTTGLAIKIENEIGIEEGTLMVLQVYFDIMQEKRKHIQIHPDLSTFRKNLFWDTDINKIDWQSQARAVIKRVFERGNQEEKEEITRFYGSKRIQSIIE